MSRLANSISMWIIGCQNYSLCIRTNHVLNILTAFKPTTGKWQPPRPIYIILIVESFHMSSNNTIILKRISLQLHLRVEFHLFLRVPSFFRHVQASFSLISPSFVSSFKLSFLFFPLHSLSLSFSLLCFSSRFIFERLFETATTIFPSLLLYNNFQNNKPNNI